MIWMGPPEFKSIIEKLGAVKLKGLTRFLALYKEKFPPLFLVNKLISWQRTKTEFEMYEF